MNLASPANAGTLARDAEGRRNAGLFFAAEVARDEVASSLRPA